MKTIGVLTGGGDCPGLNAAIRAVVRAGIRHDFETLGIRNGWMGLIEGDVEPLTDFSVSGDPAKRGNHPRHVPYQSAEKHIGFPEDQK